MKKSGAIRFFCLFFTVLMSAAAAYPEAVEQFHRTAVLPAGGQVSVENVNGNVLVAVWDSAYVDIRAEKRTKKDRRELAKVRIEVNEAGGLSVKTVAESARSLFGRTSPQVTVKYEIRVPRATPVKMAQTVNGDVELRGALGESSVQTMNGRVIAEGGAVLAAARTTNGDIRISGGSTVREGSTVNGSITAAISPGSVPMHFSAVNGAIRLSMPAGSNADVDLKTVNGSC
jgi:hypothetical protein